LKKERHSRSPISTVISQSQHPLSHSVPLLAINSAAITGGLAAYRPRLFPHRRPQRQTSHNPPALTGLHQQTPRTTAARPTIAATNRSEDHRRATSPDSFFSDLQSSRRQQATAALNPEEESINGER